MPYEAKNEASKVSEAKGNKTMSYEAKGETQGNKAKQLAELMSRVKEKISEDRADE